MMDSILSLLGLAHKAGKVEIGEEPVAAITRAKKARLLLLAGDAAPSSARRAMGFAEAGNCLCLTIDADKDALGRALGRTSCAMCAVSDIGFAAAIAEKLAAIDEKRYGGAAVTIRQKAEKMAQRKAEKVRHEKNVKQGKKKTK